MENISLNTLFIMLGFLIVFSAFFSGSETGLMSFNAYKLKHLAKTSNHAKRIIKLLSRPDRLLGVILLGNNFVNILASSIATIIAIRLWGNTGLAITISTMSLTVILLIFAEITPKTLAALKPKTVSYVAYFPLQFLLYLLYPLVWTLNLISNSFLRLLGIKQPFKKLDSLSQEEVKTVLNETSVPNYRKSILLNVFSLEQIKINDIMISKNDILGIDIEKPIKEIHADLLKSSYEHLPVYKNNIDSLIGILSVKKIPELLVKQTLTIDRLLSNLAKPYFVPENNNLYNQLINFQNFDEQIAIVVNEYGDILGLVTLQDIIGEIIGDLIIEDELMKLVKQESDGNFLVDGSVSLRDLNRITGWNLPIKTAKTMNGLILDYFEAIPSENMCILIEGFPIEVIKIKDNSVKLVRVYPRIKGQKYIYKTV